MLVLCFQRLLVIIPSDSPQLHLYTQPAISKLHNTPEIKPYQTLGVTLH